MIFLSQWFKKLVLVTFIFVAIFLPFIQADQGAGRYSISGHVSDSFPVPVLGIGVSQVFGTFSEPQRHQMELGGKSFSPFVFAIRGWRCAAQKFAKREQQPLPPVLRLWLINESLLC
ncbi:MAG: hypothetical protein K2W82_11565 [Candidatus Obscuribacterales bacterium]|nr:hypothetical protein [Candidatus Obscuribacterales bacterium]